MKGFMMKYKKLVLMLVEKITEAEDRHDDLSEAYLTMLKAVIESEKDSEKTAVEKTVKPDAERLEAIEKMKAMKEGDTIKVWYSNHLGVFERKLKLTHINKEFGLFNYVTDKGQKLFCRDGKFGRLSSNSRSYRLGGLIK